MAPIREGTEVLLLDNQRPNERFSHASAQGRHIVCGAQNRPKVVTNAGEGFSWVNAGIVAPVRGPYIGQVGTGNLIGEYAFAAARYDSARDIYSDLVWLSEPLDEDDATDEDDDLELVTETDPLIPRNVGYSTFPDEVFLGNETYIEDDILKHRTTRKALRIRDASLLGSVPKNGAQTIQYTAVKLFLRAEAVNANLTGDIYVKVNNVSSEKMDASKLTTSMAEYRFAFNSPITYGPSSHETDPGMTTISVHWDRATYPSDTKVWVKGTFADSRTNDLKVETANYDAINDRIVPAQGRFFANAFSADVTDTDSAEQTAATTFFTNQAKSNSSDSVKMLFATSKRGSVGKAKNSSGADLPGVLHASDIPTIKVRWVKANEAKNTLPYVTRGDLQGMVGKVVTIFPTSYPNVTATNFRYAIRGRIQSITYSGNDSTSGTLSDDFSSPTTRVLRGEMVIRNWVWMTRMSYRRASTIQIAEDAGIVIGFPDHGSQSLHNSGQRVEAQNTSNGWFFTGANGAAGTATDLVYFDFEVNAQQGQPPPPPVGGETTPVTPPDTAQSQVRQAGPVSIYNFDGEDGGSVTLNRVERIRGDEYTDQWDQIAFLVFSLSTGEIYVAKKVPIDTTEPVTINDLPVAGAEVYIPYNNTPLIAGRKVVAFTYKGATTVATAGQVGYDCFFDQPLNYRFTPADAIEGRGLLSVVDPDSVLLSSDIRDGTYLATIYDAQNVAVARTFIAPVTVDGYDFVDIDDEPILDTDIQLCSDQERTIPIGESTALVSTPSNLRVEIRRQVIAHVEKGSELVRLTYDFAGTEPAEVAKQYWMQHGFAVQGLDGEGIVLKVATFGGDYFGSLDNDKEYGDAVVLTDKWTGPSGAGLLIIFPRAKTVFFGKSGFRSFEQTGLNYNFDLKSKMPVQTMEVAGDKIVVITEANDIFALSPITAGVSDPANFEQAITFNIRQYFTDVRYTYPFTCVSDTTWSFPTERVGFIGSEGPNVFDFVSVSNLMEDNDETWSAFDKASLRNVTAAVDPQHPYSPSVRIAGMKLRGGTQRNQQIAFLPSRSIWLNFKEQAQTIDVMTTIVMPNGNQRVLFGGNGRLYLYGNPPKKDGNQYPLDIHLFPYVGGLQHGTINASVSLGNNQYRIRAAEAVPFDEDDPSTEGKQFQGIQEGYAFKGNSQIRLAKWDAEGNVEWATIVDYTDYQRIVIEPDSSWTFTGTAPYYFTVGAIPFKITFPKVIPTHPYGDVRMESFKLDMKDYSTSNWPYKVKIYGSQDDPNLQGNLLESINFTKSDMEPMWRSESVQLGPDWSFKMELEGVRPPDANMYVRGAMMKVRFTLGET